MSVNTFYFGPEQRQLFGVLHHNGHPITTGVVFCPCFCHETISTYSRLARLSKQMEASGIGVMRFHPSGTGESEGDTSEQTLTSVLQETEIARAVAQQRLKVRRIGYFGLRFGASMAVLAAAAQPVDFVILWCPIIDLRRYFRELLRLQLAKEAIHQRRNRVRLTTQEMINEIERGNNLDILGYPLSRELYFEMAAQSSWPQSPPARKVLWLCRPDEQAQATSIVETWRSAGADVDFQSIAEPIFWEDNGSWLPQGFVRRTLRWLTADGGADAAK